MEVRSCIPTLDSNSILVECLPMGEKNYFVDLKGSKNSRVRVYIKTEKGEVQDLMIQLEIWKGHAWDAVARYDCAHGQPHLDILMKTGPKDKIFLSGRTLKEIVDNAIDDFKANWQDYL